jgi:antitoxin FitA
MSAVTVRNIPPATHRALKARAKLRARSTEAEIRTILEDAVKSVPQKGLGTLLAEFGRKYGPIEFERDKTPTCIANFD